MSISLKNDAGTFITNLNQSNPTENVNIALPTTSGTMAMTSQLGRRNYLINGNFDSWQYGTSQTLSGYGSDDRWSNFNSISTKTHSMVNATDTERALFNSSKFSRTVVTSVVNADSLVRKAQFIENVTLLAGKTVTLSFWAKADGNKNIGFTFTQSFGTGGSPSSTVTAIGSQLVALTTTWQKKTITVTMPSIVGKTLGTDGVHTSYTSIYFGFDVGSTLSANYGGIIQQSGTFDIAQVKLEDGSVATDSWHPYDGEFGGEIQACQRYFWKGKADDISTNRYGIAGGVYYLISTKSLPTRMRVAPSVSRTVVGTYVNCTFTDIQASNDGFNVRGTVTASGIYRADSEIYSASAEL